MTDGRSAERRSAHRSAAIFTVVSHCSNPSSTSLLSFVLVAAVCVCGSQRAVQRRQRSAAGFDWQGNAPRRCRAAWGGRSGASTMCSTVVQIKIRRRHTPAQTDRQTDGTVVERTGRRWRVHVEPPVTQSSSACEGRREEYSCNVTNKDRRRLGIV